MLLFYLAAGESATKVVQYVKVSPRAATEWFDICRGYCSKELLTIGMKNLVDPKTGADSIEGRWEAILKSKIKAMRGTISVKQVAAVLDECLWRSCFFHPGVLPEDNFKGLVTAIKKHPSFCSDAVDYESSSEEVTPCNSPASSTTTNVVCDDREEEAESSSVYRSNLKRNEANRSSSAVLLNEPSRKKRREEGSPHGETSGSTVAVAIFDDGASESVATVEVLGRGGLASANPDLVNAARNILLSLDAPNCELEAVDPLEDLLFDVDSESDAQVSASSGNSELPL
ncbi:hypothetical protein FI667_g7705, partial [Globisporangium splendens]